MNGQQLNEVIENSALTLAEVAQRLDINLSTLWRLRRKENVPTVYAHAITRALELPEDQKPLMARPKYCGECGHALTKMKRRFA